MDTIPLALDPLGAPLRSDAAALPDTLEALRGVLDQPPRHRARHLGEALIECGLIDADTLARMLQAQTHVQPHRLLGQLLLDAGVLNPLQLQATLAAWMGVPLIDPRRMQPEAEALRRVPRALAEREGLLPLMLHGDALVVALPDPWDQALLEQLRFACEQRVRPVMALPGTLAPAVARAYAGQTRPVGTPGTAGADAAHADTQDVNALARALGSDADSAEPADGVAINESDNKLVRLVNALIADAVRLRASEAGRELIRRRASAGEMQAAALSAGMVTLRQDGIDKVLAGLTDLPEVIAATNQ